MPAKERSLVRSILYEAWRDFIRRPLMLLLLAAAAVPLVFVTSFLMPSTLLITTSAVTAYQIMMLVGTTICFSLIFLFWCAAVFLYDGAVRGKGERSYAAALRGMSSLGMPAVWSGLVFGLASVFVLQFAQLAVHMLLGFAAAGQGGGANEIALSLISHYLTYIAVDLVLVFLIIMPQMLALEGGRKTDEVIRASYTVVKGRYRDAVILLIVPELVVRTLFIAAGLAVMRLTGIYELFALLLVAMALLEGGRTAYIAAVFNRFYYHILEEEKKKKKKKKQPARRSASGRPSR